MLEKINNKDVDFFLSNLYINASQQKYKIWKFLITWWKVLKKYGKINTWTWEMPEKGAGGELSLPDPLKI